MGAAFPPACRRTAGWQGCHSPWRWALPEEALSKHCSNQQPFIELLEEGPGSCQEIFGDLMLNLFFNTYCQSVLPEPGAGCEGILAHSRVLGLISAFHRKIFPELKCLM